MVAVAGICYYRAPVRYRWICLLVASLLFYAILNLECLVFLLLLAAVTFLFPLWIQRATGQRSKKWRLFFGVVLTLSALCFLKYFNFAADLVNRLAEALGSGELLPQLDLILPLGISFFTFKIVGYLVDVYRGNVAPEQNFFKYLLFVSFFPEITAGPIDRAPSFLPQMTRAVLYDYETVKRGLLYIFFGLFQKFVIADRLGVIVDTVYSDPGSYAGAGVLIATFVYTFQIYCDFAAGSTLAIGCATVFGYKIPINFRQPYLSASVQEFWRRWHISLSSWFRDYLYIPLGGNRKGRLRKYLNVVIVFLCSGLWHGANLTFVLWGALHGIYQVIGGCTKNLRGHIKQALHIRPDSRLNRCWMTVCTFVLCSFAWLFFRANSIYDIRVLLRQILLFRPAQLCSVSTYELGVLLPEGVFIILCLLFTVGVDIAAARTDLYAWLSAKPAAVRWAIYIVALVVLVVFGCYGPGYRSSDFIYAQF